jgi:hypothetical protein
MRQQYFKNYAQKLQGKRHIFLKGAATERRDQSTPSFLLDHLLAQDTALLAVHSSTSVGELAARAKTNSPKEQLRKPSQILNFPVLSSHYYFGDSIWLDLVDPNIILWHPLHYNDYPHRTIQHSQTHPGKCQLARAWRLP